MKLAYNYPGGRNLTGHKATQMRAFVRRAAKDWAKSVVVTVPHRDVASFVVKVDAVVADAVERALREEGFVVRGSWEPYGPKWQMLVDFPPGSPLGDAEVYRRKFFAKTNPTANNAALYHVVQYASTRAKKGEPCTGLLTMGQAKRTATRLRRQFIDLDYRIERP